MRSRILLAAIGLAAAGAVAQTPLATSTVPDRLQRIAEGAKKEGEVVIYTSMPADDIKALTDAFENKHGVKARVWRASSEKTLQRIVTEARNGRFEADIAETNGPELEALVREKLLQPVRSPSHAGLVAQAIQSHGAWVGTRLKVFVAAYNTLLVKKEDVPKKWEDLLDPKWKGKLGIEAGDADWYSGVVGALGEAKGLKLFRDIVQAAGISVRRGHTPLTSWSSRGRSRWH